ncbi:hypothetical protein LP419_17040 [Massilia sp. H-1]|nr:hypothetical protein LP419_17040 [Massilia sp. H-1]
MDGVASLPIARSHACSTISSPCGRERLLDCRFGRVRIAEAGFVRHGAHAHLVLAVRHADGVAAA